MTSNLDRRLNRLEGGRSEEPREIVPGLLLTDTQISEVMRAVDGRTRGIPSKVGDHA